METIPLRGKSMYPVLREGDALAVEWFFSIPNIETLRPGEIVIFRDSLGEFISHRVISTNSSTQTVTTAGDYSLQTESHDLFLILGRVTAVQLSHRQKLCAYRHTTADRILAFLSPHTSVYFRGATRLLGHLRRNALARAGIA